MKKFEIGKEYFTRSICDSECIFSIKITGRTAKTVSYEYMGESRRSKIRFDDSGEYIQPDRYSMAPTFRAEREVQPEEEAPAAEESAVSVPAEDAAPSNVITISQPADNGTVIVMIGQRVECVCGACYPVEGGTVYGMMTAATKSPVFATMYVIPCGVSRSYNCTMSITSSSGDKYLF